MFFLVLLHISSVFGYPYSKALELLGQLVSKFRTNKPSRRVMAKICKAGFDYAKGDSLAYLTLVISSI